MQSKISLISKTKLSGFSMIFPQYYMKLLTPQVRHSAGEQLHPIKGCQSLLQRHGELIGEAPPVVLAHLVLKSMKDLKSNTDPSSYQVIMECCLLK